MLPQDPIILLSYINTLLRDQYPTFIELCRSQGLDADAVERKLNKAGFEYIESINQFR